MGFSDLRDLGSTGSPSEAELIATGQLARFNYVIGEHLVIWLEYPAISEQIDEP